MNLACAEAFRYYARAVNSAAAAMKNGEDAYGMMVSALEKITGFCEDLGLKDQAQKYQRLLSMLTDG